MPQQDNQSEIIAEYMDLFSKCEAMRPKHVRSCSTDPHYALLMMPGMDHGTGCDGAAQDCVLALCRCAVEDWLVKRQGIFIDHSDAHGEIWYVFDQHDMEGATMLGSGPTIHAALISAARAVLDSEAVDAQQGGKE